MVTRNARLLGLAFALACADEAVTTDAEAASEAADVTGDTAPADAQVEEPDGPCLAELRDGALSVACGASARFVPFVVADGVFSVGRDCMAEGDVLRCESPAGSLEVAATPAGWVVRLTPAIDTTVTRLGLTGGLILPGATGWVSNGFQSWSMSGVLALREAPLAAARDAALSAFGDPETLRSGAELSWTWTAVGGGGITFVGGATRVDRWKAWAAVDGVDPKALTVTLACGAGEAVAAASGAVLASEPYFLGMGDEAVVLRAYGAALPTRRVEPFGADVGWNSWYDLWDAVDAQAVLENAQLARAAFDAAGFDAPLRVVVDDGWQVGWGDWVAEPCVGGAPSASCNPKFPEGLAGVASALHAQGFEVGVWLAPLLVDGDSPLVTEHPDWFVGGAVYPHGKHGPMRVLDVTHTGAAEHLRAAITRLVGAGIDFLKIDFLFAGTAEGARAEGVTGMEAYRRALVLIREAAGPATTLLAVGAPAVAGFDLVDGWRLGPDIALEAFDANWYFVAPQARNVAVRWPFCRAVACDADPPILRMLAQNEVVAGAWVAALAGGAFFLSDDLRALPAERHGWAFAPEVLAAALTGEAAVPDSIFPAAPPSVLGNAFEDALAGQGSVEVPVVWTIAGGGRVALNVRDAPVDVGTLRIPARSALFLGDSKERP